MHFLPKEKDNKKIKQTFNKIFFLKNFTKHQVKISELKCQWGCLDSNERNKVHPRESMILGKVIVKQRPYGLCL